MTARSATAAFNRVRQARNTAASIASDLVTLTSQTNSGRITHLAMMACQLRDLADELARGLDPDDDCRGGCPGGRCDCAADLARWEPS